MNRSMIRKLIVPYTLLSVGTFLFLSWRLPPDKLIITLNALFVGTMISITVAYGRVLWRAIRGKMQFLDVQQLVIGLLMFFAAYGISVSSSIYVRAADLPATTLFATALGRWLAINGAIIQITAPDFGEGIFYGRDRQLLWGGLVAGALVAIGVFIAQDYGLLDV